MYNTKEFLKLLEFAKEGMSEPTHHCGEYRCKICKVESETRDIKRHREWCIGELVNKTLKEAKKNEIKAVMMFHNKYKREEE